MVAKDQMSVAIIEGATPFEVVINEQTDQSNTWCREDDTFYCNQGAVSIRKTVLPGMAIPMLKIRRPNGRLIFNMEITIRR